MIPNVRWLDTQSQTVRLALGVLDDGMRNGNREAPAVPITPMIASDDAMNPRRVLRINSSKADRHAPAMPIAGNNQMIGWLW